MQGLIPGDDVLVVGDGFHGPTKELVEAFGAPFRYVATTPTRDWGHSQSNYGVKNVKGDMLIYQDDDDIFLPRAFDEIRKVATRFPNAPLIGRVKTPYRGILWKEANTDAVLDGHCLVVPNVKDKLGFFTSEYVGDQAWIKTCLEPYEEVYWIDRVWTLTRPAWTLYAFRGLIGNDPEKLMFKLAWEAAVPGILNRPLNGGDDWTWTFCDKESSAGAYMPVATLHMYLDDERVIATISARPGTEKKHLQEVAEFAAWAAQGLDCWMRQQPDDQEIVEALTSRGFVPHGTNEFISDWPPHFLVEKSGDKIIRPTE